MATLETLQAQLDRMEREQKVRDNGLLRSFDIFTNAIERLQQTVVDMEATNRMPMEMGEFMTLMTTLLNRQKQLLESIGERVDDEVAWADGDLDDQQNDDPVRHIP